MTQIEKIQKLVKQAENIKAKIAMKIKSLPDNPRIHRLNSRCFILSFRDLGDNWTPEYHDFKLQYRLLSQVIETKPLVTLLEFLKTTVQKGLFKVNTNYTVKLHPDVVVHLKSFLGVKF